MAGLNHDIESNTKELIFTHNGRELYEIRVLYVIIKQERAIIIAKIKSMCILTPYMAAD